MTNRPEEKSSALPTLRQIMQRMERIVVHNWGIKLVCVLLAVVLWGGLISQDPNLTREKSFTDVSINYTGGDILTRNGLIVVSGLDQLAPIQLRAAVPQRNYSSANANNYNVRVDLSRITVPGEQKLPVISTSSATFGQVTWMSQNEVTVQVDRYVTRRRIPVQLGAQSAAPAGFYAPPPSVDPAVVVISGPSEQVSAVARVVAQFDASLLPAQPGSQISAAPFILQAADGTQVDASLITVTSNEAILLDTVLVEQTLYPLKSLDIDLSDITTGQPASGFEVRGVTASPAYLSVAGTSELLKSLDRLLVSSRIDISGARDSLVRAIKVEKPAGAQYMSEDAVYVTIEIGREGEEASPAPLPAADP